MLYEVITIDLVVLDLMLPGEDGLPLCRELRGRSKIPIIMLTAMGEETDRIVGQVASVLDDMEAILETELDKAPDAPERPDRQALAAWWKQIRAWRAERNGSSNTSRPLIEP